MRKPVDGVGTDELLKAPALGGNPSELSVSWSASELLGVEVQPVAIRGVLGAVQVSAASLQIAGGAAEGRDKAQPSRCGEVTGW